MKPPDRHVSISSSQSTNILQQALLCDKKKGLQDHNYLRELWQCWSDIFTSVDFSMLMHVKTTQQQPSTVTTTHVVVAKKGLTSMPTQQPNFCPPIRSRVPQFPPWSCIYHSTILTMLVSIHWHWRWRGMKRTQPWSFLPSTFRLPHTCFGW